MERGDDGIWRYAEVDVAVPGASDIRLADALDVRVVGRSTGEPEAVLVEQSLVDEHKALAWVPDVANQLRSEGREDVFEVPWAIWQERAADPVGVRAPEVDGRGLERLMALEERAVRLARHGLDVLTVRRNRSVALATGLGMTRRQAGEILGLSPARVQQLVDDAPEAVKLEVAEFLADALLVLRDVGPSAAERSGIALPEGRDDGFVDELLALGLLEEDPRDAGLVHLTEEGEQAELHLRARWKKTRRPARG